MPSGRLAPGAYPLMTLRALLDGAVFVDDQPGDDPPVVALHGWGRSRGDVAFLGGKGRLVSVDLPGFGSSPEPAAGWGAAEYADHLATALEELALPPAVIFGHSFGGRVGVCLAARRPDLVSGLVVCGTPLLRQVAGKRPTVRYRIIRRAWKMGLVSDTSMERRRRRSGSADYRNASPRMREVLVRVVNEDYSEQLRAIRCPAAFVWGELDDAAPLPVAREAAPLVDTLTSFDVVDGAGHDVHRSDPDRVVAVVDAVRVLAGSSTGGATS